MGRWIWCWLRRGHDYAPRTLTKSGQGIRHECRRCGYVRIDFPMLKVR